MSKFPHKLSLKKQKNGRSSFVEVVIHELPSEDREAGDPTGQTLIDLIVTEEPSLAGRVELLHLDVVSDGSIEAELAKDVVEMFREPDWYPDWLRDGRL